MKPLIFFCALFSITVLAADPDKSNVWSQIRTPKGSTPQAIGSNANGCQLGAQMLEAEGEGFISIRRWRNRFYSQPITLRLVHQVGKEVAALHHAQILIGDLSQPIGGEMPFGHSSHQNGLDVDIWFYTTPQGQQPASDVEPPSMVDAAAGTLVPGLWKVDYRDALYAAATFPETNRIFVNPVIKQHLCDSESDTRWLHKIRPWKGHDAHFHIRLNCQAGSPECVTQAPIPAGDGCDADLRKWVADQSEAVLHPKPAKAKQPAPPKIPPASCTALLTSP
ncbi:MAG: penicillin-insensitive murein endopeptidase [Cardiobacteriaceae bacterium]|nr:penicillin-insensitive murein endopeptidase [Cardiobacteriaceae bacterium]